MGLAGFLFILTLSNTAGTADKPVSLDSGFHQMYDLDFAAAHETFEAWETLHPDDPLGAAANAAAYLFAEFERLHVLDFDRFTDSRQLEDFGELLPDPKTKTAFESELAKADRIANNILARSSEDCNALFAKTLTDGLRANYAALIEKRKHDGLNFFKSSRSIAEKLIAINPNYYDAYLAVGIENYLLGLRSAPTRLLLRLNGAETNNEKGLANLKITAEQGRYLAPYARVLLAIAYLRDQDRAAAGKLLAALVREFPRNRLYQSELSRLQG